jgi:hydrogenase-4 component E
MMSDGVFTQALDMACGAFLLAAVVVLWRRDLAAGVRVFAFQGLTLAAIAALLGVHEDRWDLLVVAAGIALLRAWALPALMRRALRAGGADRETQPLVNVAASLLTAAALTLLAYAVSRPLVALHPAPATRALPVGLAVVLIGFFILVTRRRALSQVVGFLLLDNGITAVAFLAASGVPLIVELGVSFDVLLAVLVLHILTTRMRTAFGHTDIDDLRELHD